MEIRGNQEGGKYFFTGQFAQKERFLWHIPVCLWGNNMISKPPLWGTGRLTKAVVVRRCAPHHWRDRTQHLRALEALGRPRLLRRHADDVVEGSWESQPATVKYKQQLKALANLGLRGSCKAQVSNSSPGGPLCLLVFWLFSAPLVHSSHWLAKEWTHLGLQALIDSWLKGNHKNLQTLLALLGFSLTPLV